MFLFKFAKIIMITLTMLTLTWLFFACTQTSVSAGIFTPKDPTFKPSTTKPQKQFLGWSADGYILQPKALNYATLGDSVTLNAKTVRRPWTIIKDPLDFEHYYWWKSDDGVTWKRVSPDFSRNSSLTVTPQKVGKSWYRLRTQYSGRVNIMISLTLDSEIAEIETVPAPVNAKSVSVDVDSDYLYNVDNPLVTNSTTATATTDPVDSTQTVEWSSSDESLATVDKGGLIKANTNQKSGTVTITATIRNTDETVISDSKKIHIGGGLDDQTVHAGDPATFKLKTNTHETRDNENNDVKVTVDWYKDGSKIKSNDDLFYHIEQTQNSDNDSTYHAVVTVTDKKHKKNEKDKSYSFQTNDAKLTVLPSNIANVSVTNTLNNKTYCDHTNTETSLDDVISGDELEHHITLENSSGKDINNSYLTIPIYRKTVVNKVKIDDTVLEPNVDYSVANWTDDGCLLNIKVGTLKSLSKKTIEFESTVEDIFEQSSFNSTPYYFGFDSANELYENDGTKMQINFINNSLSTHFHDINFENIQPLEHNIIKHRQEDSNTAVTINDQRREKKPYKIYLQQANQFMNPQHEKLDADLFFQQKGTSHLLKDETLVVETYYGEKIHSIEWGRDEGLLLHLNNNYATPGNYSAQLTWSIQESI